MSDGIIRTAARLQFPFTVGARWAPSTVYYSPPPAVFRVSKNIPSL